jgi:UDP:flavonoid glycosyltransferase YjiC (YdhE family)
VTHITREHARVVHHRCPMRILVASTRGTGHFRPLLPFVLAARDAGHEILVAGPQAVGVAAERHALPHRDIALAAPERYDHVNALIRAAASDEQALRIAVEELFVGSHGRAGLPGMLALVERWQPDLVLRETAEVASLLAAHAYNVPDVRAAISLPTGNEDVFLDLAARALDALREDFGLILDHDAARAKAAPVLTQSPEVLDGETDPPARVRRYSAPSGGPGAALPDWWGGSADPLVPISFGTVAPTEGLYPQLYRAVIDAVADLPIRVLVTVGEHADPAELEPLPPSVHAARWVPQGRVMPHSAAMVHHGGGGTTLAALAAGVPSVVLPLFADQPINALLVESLGAGFALTGGGDEIPRIAEALAAVLEDPRYAAGARRVADEIRELPPVADSVEDLETFAAVPVHAA